MPNIRAKHRVSNIPSHPPAFSLPELTVSIVLISIIAVALGLAMNNSQRRAEDMTVSLTQTQKENTFLKTLLDDIRWAVEIPLLSSDRIDVKISDDPAGSVFETVGYFWNYSELKLYYFDKGLNPVMVMDDVYNFTLLPVDYETNSDGEAFLRILRITIQIGPDPSNAVSRQVELPNTPQVLAWKTSL